MSEKTTLCECGTRVKLRALKMHKRNPWHGFARSARRLRALGFSYAEVARQLKAGRQTIWVRLRKEGL